MHEIYLMVVENPLTFVALGTVIGAWVGVILMACMTAASSADEDAERMQAVYGDKVVCCNHNCNQGDDCPLRVRGGGA
jgi:hypothetical protein